MYQACPQADSLTHQQEGPPPPPVVEWRREFPRWASFFMGVMAKSLEKGIRSECTGKGPNGRRFIRVRKAV